MDDLFEASGVKVSEVSMILLNLEIKNFT
ncbi:MAG: hypothetical protein HQ532_02220 [Candidatus Omnitrophica bacterium]|nr:hypothetical protein [Candidatus Omnitrophota bacterium]